MIKTRFIKAIKFSKYTLQLWQKGSHMKSFQFYNINNRYFRKMSVYLPLIIIEWSYMKP
jgi:hypothetical protein